MTPPDGAVQGAIHIADCLAHAVRWDGVFGCNLLIGFVCFDPVEPLYWFSVKMTARLDVNATPGGRMSPIAPGIVPECSGASRVKRAARTGFAALDAPCALWYSNACGREGTEWGSWDQSVHAGTLFARRSRRSFRACSSLRSRSDQIWVALPSMKSSGAM